MTVLSSAWEIWVAVVSVSVIAVAGVFLGVGLTAAGLHFQQSKVWLLAPLLTVVLGACLAFALSAIPAGLLAAVYVSIPASMALGVAVVWGGIMTVFIVAFQVGAFHKIL